MTLGLFLESLHIVEFGLLYLLLVLALKVNHHFNRLANLFIAVFSILYGVIDEVHQLFVDGRSFTFIDIIKDWMGVMFFWLPIHYYTFRKNR